MYAETDRTLTWARWPAGSLRIKPRHQDVRQKGKNKVIGWWQKTNEPKWSLDKKECVGSSALGSSKTYSKIWRFVRFTAKLQWENNVVSLTANCSDRQGSHRDWNKDKDKRDVQTVWVIRRTRVVDDLLGQTWQSSSGTLQDGSQERFDSYKGMERPCQNHYSSTKQTITNLWTRIRSKSW